MGQILIPVGILAGLGLLFGILLGIASKAFAVKVDERIPKIIEKLPGANCGGCGYSGCAALAEAIVKGEADPNSCSVGGEKTAKEIAAVMGVEAKKTVRMRAQVMCSGTCDLTDKKYKYAGASDCIAAAELGGGDKACPNGCIGLGTCVAACPFNAIKVVNGVAAVDYLKCRGCGVCVSVCPKHLIELVPYDSIYWVGCKSESRGTVTRKLCDVGCIGCKICEKNCEVGAIKVNGYLAKIDYDKCTSCGVCAYKCPRHIIWSAKAQGKGLVISRERLDKTGTAKG